MSDSEADTTEKYERPNGTAALTAGVMLLCVAALAALVWSSTDIVDYAGEINPAKINQKVWAAIIAGASLSIGLISIAVGYVVRALYFIDGVEKKPKA